MNIVGVTPQNNFNYQNTAFKSKIKLVSYADFKAMTDGLNKKKHEVGYPWTPETMKKGKNIYTTKLGDCIAVAIINKGKVKFGHLCTRNKQEAIDTNQKEFDISEVERRLIDGIDFNDENIHGIIFGGFNFGGKSVCNYPKVRLVEQIFQKYDIPYTTICGRKNTHVLGKFGLFYKNKEDTMYIAPTHTETPAAGYDSLLNRPKEVEIKDGKVYYNVYRRNKATPWLYDWERKCGNAETYFKDHFSDVSMSKFDEIV